MSAIPSALAAFNSQLRQPRCMVKINGNAMPGVIEIEVNNNSLREADTFRVTLAVSALQAPYDAMWLTSQTTLNVEVLAGFPANPASFNSSGLESLITGNADTVNLNPAERTLTICGRDLTSLFIDSRTAEKWNNQSASQIAQTLAARHGLQANVTDTAGLAGGLYQIDHAIPTQGQTEWDLLCWLGQQVSFVVYVDSNTLYFNPPPDQTQAPKFPIAWNEADSQNSFSSNTCAIEFERTLTVGKTLTVTVRSWNQQQRKGFSVSYPSSHGGKIQPGSATSPAQNFSYVIGNLTKDQAQQRAAAIYNELIKNEMRMTVEMPAVKVADLDVMHRIAVTGTGTPFDQTYFPESIQRRMSFDEGYRMTVQARNHSDEVEPMQGLLA